MLLYALSNNTKKYDMNHVVLFDDHDVSFSYDFKQFLSRGLYARYSPIGYDFKYVKRIALRQDSVYIVRNKKDIVNGTLTEDGHIDIEKLNKITKKVYHGYIIFSPASHDKYTYAFPHFSFHDVLKCVENVYITSKREPTDRYWVAVEPCAKMLSNNCVVSNTCMLRQGQCATYSALERLPLRHLNLIMKPFKYYMFTEFQVNKRLQSFDVDKTNISKKPPGFWFGIGDEWLQHIKKTNFWMSKYNYLYELEVNVDNLVAINNMKELQAFSSMYGVVRENNITSDIDWFAVTKKTKKHGIVVSHNFKKSYHKYSRFNKMSNVFNGVEWYLSWDIASGVVWDARAIKNISMIYKKEQGEFVSHETNKTTLRNS
jgi:hypothetical protein